MLAYAVESKKIDDATLALAAGDLGRAIDQFGPVVESFELSPEDRTRLAAKVRAGAPLR